MFLSYIRQFLILFILGFTSLAFAQVSQLGRYSGLLTHDSLKQQQFVRLDLIPNRVSNNSIELKAVLVLQFGDFKNDEYVSYHYDNVFYDLIKGTLIFDQANESVTLTIDRFNNGEISGSFYFAGQGLIGRIHLRKDGKVNPTLPLISSVGGEYFASCNGKRKNLQLYTMRSVEDTSRVGNPFGTYQIQGQAGTFDKLSPLYKSRYIADFNIVNSSYNFYSGSMILTGDFDKTSCSVRADQISCDNGCSYRAISKAPLLQTKPITSTSNFSPIQESALLPEGTGLSGSYVGYLHHEFLNRYQPGRLELVTYQGEDNGIRGLQVSATAQIYFGDSKNSESISYRFAPQPYPNPILKPQFLFSRLNDDVDAFLQVTEVDRGVVKGIWYSLLFGRVGAFEFRKPDLPPVTIPSSARVIQSLSGDFEEADWHLQLRVFQGRTPPNTENPFFPLEIGGWAQVKELSAKKVLQKGSYDFYTDKIGIHYEDDRWILGRRAPSGALEVNITSASFGTLMPLYEAPKILNLNRN